MFEFIKKTQSQDLINYLPDAVVVLGYDKKISDCNIRAEMLFGYARKDLRGKTASFLFDEGVEPVYDAMINHSRIPTNVRTKNGEHIVVEITASDSELNQKIIVCARDVTETHNMIKDIIEDYKAAKERSKLHNSFISDMSGDIKTPLHSIIGFSQALIDGIGGDLSEKQAKYLDIINRNASSLSLLMGSVLDIAKLDAGQMTPDIKQFDVISLINFVNQQIEPKAKEKKLAYEVDTQEVVKRKIFSDENMLRQVLLTVLDNAVKFTETGNIKMRVSHPDLDYVKYQGMVVPADYTDKSYLMFNITDTGVGIPESDLDCIFDEYSMVARQSSKKYSGYGLNLAIARKILEELSGVIWVESEVRLGSTFSFIIPIQEPHNIVIHKIIGQDE